MAIDQRYVETFKSGDEGAQEGMQKGAMMGGPWGAVIGGIAGGIKGNILGWLEADARMKAEKRKRAAWLKAQQMLEDSRIRADNQRRELLGLSYSPVNSSMVSMYGPQADAMGDGKQFSAGAPPPKRSK